MQPPPDLIDGKEEYEIKEILQSRKFGQECYDSFFLALLYADTSDCFLSSFPHPLIGLLYFYDLILLMRSYLATSRPVRYTSSVAIRSTMYDTHLRATHTTTSSIRGVQIPIYLVSNTTDSL